MSTIYATGATDTEVQTALDAAVSGDTVIVPAGTQTWTTTVTCSGKRITITGAGIGLTNITDNCSGNGGALNVSGCSATNFATISGFTFIRGRNSSYGMVQISGTAPVTFEVGFRFHHCSFTVAAITRGLYIYWIWGLIDNCTFTVTDPSASIQVITVDGASAGSDGGYTPWARANQFGTDQAVYIEDCTFTFSTQSDTAFDAYNGARCVIRHNIAAGTSVGSHGTDSGNQRGLMQIEMYANVFANNYGSGLRSYTIRGGSGFFFDNTFSGTPGYPDGFVAMVYRCTISDSYSWNLCDGTQWDIGSTNLSDAASRTTVTANTVARFLSTAPDTICTGAGSCTRFFDGSGTGGYPCRDQPGRGHDQALMPLYEWNNGSSHIATYDGGSPFGLPITTWLLENRDYYNYTGSFNGTVGVGRGLLSARPATCTTGVGYWATDTQTFYVATATDTWSAYYTPYTYPHPLQGGSTKKAIFRR